MPNLERSIYQGQVIEYDGKEAKIDFIYMTGNVKVAFADHIYKVFSSREFWSSVEDGTIKLLN